MMDGKRADQWIRDEWFKNHVAIYGQVGIFKVLDWEQPGTGINRCRFIFDGYNMYISGDLGTAVFRFTEKADLHIFTDYDLRYFHSKLDAFCEDKYTHSEDLTVGRLREWLNELKNDGVEYDHEMMRHLFEAARSANCQDRWHYEINTNIRFISDLDPDYWEWIYDCGQTIPMRVRGFLIALQMASKQIKHDLGIA